MATKTVQVEVVTYKPRNLLTCDGPGCGEEVELKESALWWRLNLCNSAAFNAHEYHFCTLECLAKWTAVA